MLILKIVKIVGRVFHGLIERHVVVAQALSEKLQQRCVQFALGRKLWWVCSKKA